MLALMLLAATSLDAHAASPQVTVGDDWTLTFDGHFRPRFYGHTGKDFVDAGNGLSMSVAQRARLGTTLQHGTDGPSFTVRLQDVRAWGEEADTLGDYSADGLDMHEAFGLIPLGGGMSLKLGRQEIAFDNHRLVGTVGWSNQGRSFDGLRFDRKGDSYSVTFFATSLSADMKQLFGGVHASYELVEGHELAIIGLGRTLDPDTRHTVGLQASGKASGFSYTAEGYYQLGEEANTSVSAWMAGANLGYTLDSSVKPGVVGRAEILSSDGTSQGTFDTLYATNHKFYGEMDFFLAVGPHTANLGLMDMGGKVHLSPVDSTTLSVDFHHFSSFESDASGESALGDEIDTKVVVKAGQGVSVDALYGLFLPGEAMRTVAGVGAGTDLELEHVFFLSTNLKF